MLRSTPWHCRLRGCESSLLSTIPESRNRGRNNRFSSERTLEGANEIAVRFSFYREWNIFGFACHACGNSMEFEWRSSEEKACYSEGATCIFRYCEMYVNGILKRWCRYWFEKIVEFNWIHQWFIFIEFFD